MRSTRRAADHHGRAGLVQHLGEADPEPTRGAGDDGHRAVETEQRRGARRGSGRSWSNLGTPTPGGRSTSAPVASPREDPDRLRATAANRPRRPRRARRAGRLARGERLRLALAQRAPHRPGPRPAHRHRHRRGPQPAAPVRHRRAGPARPQPGGARQGDRQLDRLSGGRFHRRRSASASSSLASRPPSAWPATSAPRLVDEALPLMRRLWSGRARAPRRAALPPRRGAAQGHAPPGPAGGVAGRSGRPSSCGASAGWATAGCPRS